MSHKAECARNNEELMMTKVRTEKRCGALALCIWLTALVLVFAARGTSGKPLALQQKRLIDEAGAVDESFFAKLISAPRAAVRPSGHVVASGRSKRESSLAMLKDTLLKGEAISALELLQANMAEKQLGISVLH